MSESIQIKKLKRIMYSALRWRLQLPNYVPHNPVPPDEKLSEFGRGVKCAYMDLLQEIEKIEQAESQRGIWRFRKKHDFFPMYGNQGDDEEAYLDEIRWEKQEPKDYTGY